MKKIVSENISFERKDLSKAEAKKLFKEEKYKLELLKDIDFPSVYKLGKFADLCSGPHVPSSGKIIAFKLMKIAGAYWKGNSKTKMLQRINGVAFPTDKSLKKYLNLLEEAEKRDHRKIGKVRDLF